MDEDIDVNNHKHGRFFVGTCLFVSFLWLEMSFSLFLLMRFFLSGFFQLETFAFSLWLLAKTRLSSSLLKRVFTTSAGVLVPFFWLPLKGGQKIGCLLFCLQSGGMFPLPGPYDFLPYVV